MNNDEIIKQLRKIRTQITELAVSADVWLAELENKEVDEYIAKRKEHEL